MRRPSDPVPRSPSRRLGALLLLLLAATAAAGGCNRGPERVVLVTIDTLRADRLGCYGREGARTPTLDGIAAEGVRFEAALSLTKAEGETRAHLLYLQAEALAQSSRSQRARSPELAPERAGDR